MGSPASKTFGQIRVGRVSTVSTVITTPRSQQASCALAVANRDAIVAPVPPRHVSSRILIFRLAARLPLLGCTDAVDVAVDRPLGGTATYRSRDFRLGLVRRRGVRSRWRGKEPDRS